MTGLRVLIAPSGFKEAQEPDSVADSIARGLRRVDPSLSIQLMPMIDGGEGTARILAQQTGGRLVAVRVTGPVGEWVPAHFALLGGAHTGTAVVEAAQAAGLRLVPTDRRNPLRTTTRGVGELIRAALDAGAERVVVGCGDSGTNDAGAGAAQALGVRLLDASGRDLGLGGGELLGLAQIVLDDCDPRLHQIPVQVACNWAVTFAEVTRHFSAAKGADSQQMQRLEAALEQFAAVVERDLGVDIRSQPGSGASGGLGGGLAALAGAQLYPRFDIIDRYINIDQHLERVDLVITAEGRLDAQTGPGKVPAEIARRAQRFGIPVVVLTGSIGKDARQCLAYGINGYTSILDSPCSLSEAMSRTPELLEDAAEQLGRFIRVGMDVKERRRVGF